ncbi:hypothetical protein PF005_g29381 [Phytophthora fragariae]|uniref:Uncharacterized protein n=1 Tax=Phytophthora fragariae TaxID=53985 RepID=A0A6A3VR35_9STRA|nr:hypothetical protein PF003_g18370 [Phytophthora fragariae]KAE8922525.1 hypothetical protein PF009_g27211 [Phytophthora fragariae]KAE8963922.1 hypothetical protein PF011_g28856 [Phytophthora fragariae]KAE9061999.1 hypothetical protein PF010_g29591 [Phytophthora fragariae]KAE9070655.1 hypothetical protein PF007_g26862 [Phytophthora fragariae]
MAAWLRAACFLAATSVLRNGVSMPPKLPSESAEEVKAPTKTSLSPSRSAVLKYTASPRLLKAQRIGLDPCECLVVPCTAQGSINAQNGECLTSSASRFPSLCGGENLAATCFQALESGGLCTPLVDMRAKCPRG